ALMLFDYRQSPVGPYRELLFAAGRNLRWRHHLFSVTRIWVSTEASAVSGRENWAIPKQTAEFEVIKERDSERVIVQRDRHAEVDLTVAPGYGRLPIPVLGSLAPPSWRTIVQFRDGQVLATRLSARGVFRPAKLLDFRTLPQAFPDVNEGKLVAGFYLEDFRLRFPAPRLTPRPPAPGSP
ncbi:MAG: hypothetical protein E6G30_08870, partial [Actinobacteria bacterium]